MRRAPCGWPGGRSRRPRFGNCTRSWAAWRANGTLRKVVHQGVGAGGVDPVEGAGSWWSTQAGFLAGCLVLLVAAVVYLALRRGREETEGVGACVVPASRLIPCRRIRHRLARHRPVRHRLARHRLARHRLARHRLVQLRRQPRRRAQATRLRLRPRGDAPAIAGTGAAGVGHRRPAERVFFGSGASRAGGLPGGYAAA